MYKLKQKKLIKIVLRNDFIHLVKNLPNHAIFPSAPNTLNAPRR